MFIDKDRKTLDYHFLLWDYEVSQEIIAELKKIEARKVPMTQMLSDEDSEEEHTKIAEQSHSSACCAIF